MTQRRYEVRLLRFLWRHGFGVFTCDEFQIFSNASVVELFAADDESAPEDLSIPVTVINASLSADDQAGRWNANVFVHVWRRVFLERRYKRYDWTLKLDVDTVFFPGSRWSPPLPTQVGTMARLAPLSASSRR
eukprot:UN4524